MESSALACFGATGQAHAHNIHNIIDKINRFIKDSIQETAGCILSVRGEL